MTMTPMRFHSVGVKLKPELVAEMASPSFIAIHPNKKFLYAVGEGDGKDAKAATPK